MHQVKVFEWLTDINEWLKQISEDPHIEIKEITPISEGRYVTYVVHYYDGGIKNE